MRSGTDGGEPLFEIRIRSGGKEATVSTRGRFGEGSFGASGPELLPELGCEYRFVNCGPGVIKLEIRPKTKPWSADLQATYRDPRSHLGRDHLTVTTGIVRLSEG